MAGDGIIYKYIYIYLYISHLSRMCARHDVCVGENKILHLNYKRRIIVMPTKLRVIKGEL